MTWFELNWTQNTDLFDLEEAFFKPHHLNSFRRQFLASVAKEIFRKGIEGQLIEFGVYFGLGSYLMLRNTSESYEMHLVDSFTGLSVPTLVGGDSWKAGDMAVDAASVKTNLEEYSHRLHIHEGSIPNVFLGLPAIRIALAHIDVDLYEPTRFSLEWLKDRLSPGASIVCDDYGFWPCPGATKAIDEFSDKNPRFIRLPMPVGGSLLFEH